MPTSARQREINIKKRLHMNWTLYQFWEQVCRDERFCLVALQTLKGRRGKREDREQEYDNLRAIRSKLRGLRLLALLNGGLVLPERYRRDA